MHAREVAVAGLVVLLLGGLVVLAQLSAPGLVDSDSYFHATYAARLLEQGASRSFEATTFSTWRDGFADYNLSFHLYLFPFVQAGGLAGAKLGVAILSILFLTLLATFPLRHRLRWPLVWSVLALAIGWHVLFRLLPVRPHVLSMILTLLWIEATLAGRRRLVGASAFLLAWNHFSAPLLALLAGLAALVSRGTGSRTPVTALRWTLGGLLLGYVVNPYVPNNLLLAYQGVVDMFSAALPGASGTPPGIFGQEFAEVGTRTALVSHAVPFLAATLCAVPFLTTRASLDTRGRVVATYAAAVFLLGLVSSRFLHELAVPVGFLLGAVLLDGVIRSREAAPPARALRLVAASVVVVAGVVLIRTASEARALRDYRTQEVYRPAVGWLAEHVPEGEQIFHLGTGDFNALYAFDDRHRFVTALDPMFMRAYDPSVYEAWLSILTRRDPAPVRTIRRTFAAEVIFVRRARRIDELFDEMLATHPDAVALYRDPYASIYRVSDAAE